jgi:hypothetical protein
MQEMIGETVPSAAPDAIRDAQSPQAPASAGAALGDAERPREIGGRDGPEPTRYGDWEKNGRCIDF